MRCKACDELLPYYIKSDLCAKCIEIVEEQEKEPHIAHIEVTEVWNEYN